MSFVVWCQAGDADGFRYETGIEPPDEIVIWRVPGGAVLAPAFRFVRVLDDSWEGSTVYVRQPDVEQFDHERIYYPKAAV